MSAPLKSPVSLESPGYRAILWLILIGATMLDTILIVGIVHAHGGLFWWWLIQKSQADPLIAFLLADILLLRLGLFILGMKFLETGQKKKMSAWLLAIPVIGGPMLFAALLSSDD